MQKFKLTDHIHYDRNDPGQPQSVYFDCDITFSGKISELVNATIDKAEQERLTDIRILLMRISAEAERVFGPLTMGQLLCLTHTISSWLSKMSSFQEGYAKGIQDAMNARMEVIHQQPGSPVNTTWGKGGQA